MVGVFSRAPVKSLAEELRWRQHLFHSVYTLSTNTHSLSSWSSMSQRDRKSVLNVISNDLMDDKQEDVQKSNSFFETGQ